MGKGMGPFLCIAYVYLDRIVPRFGFYVHEDECMVMCGINVLCESFAHHICIHPHT